VSKTGEKMKIAKYQYKDKEYYGIMQPEKLVCLPDLAKNYEIDLPSTIEDFIGSTTAEEIVSRLLAETTNSELDAFSIPLSKTRLLTPIDSPPKILCLGLNYDSHVNETQEKRPEQPVVFMKPNTTVIGPNDKIIKRSFVKELDYEAELAIVIGRQAKDIVISEALNHVFGYTILDDVSARDFQFTGSQWTTGKSFDTFAPIGPCITTSRQLPNINNLAIKTWINGELRQDGNTRDMIFSVSEIIYHLSRIMTLKPCDIIATGTPSGVGMAMQPQKWLSNDDRVKIEIEGIGILENTVEERK
jgi:2-keto-4-pentenoate hydratase/2-oxohepta-3-ene-1,7-dioic acid hydratase in catechol pathway